MKRFSRLQTTQPTSGGSVTAVTNCCENCVKPSRPKQWGPDILGFDKAAIRALLISKVGDIETNPGPITQTNGSRFVVSAINKYMLESRYP